MLHFGRGTRRTVLGRGAALGGLPALAAACQSSGNAGGQKTAAPAKITVITRGGGDGQGMDQVIIPAFTKQYDNIKVDNASLGGEPDYWAKVVGISVLKELTIPQKLDLWVDWLSCALNRRVGSN